MLGIISFNIIFHSLLVRIVKLCAGLVATTKPLHNTVDLKVKLPVLEVFSRLYSIILSYDTGAKKLFAAGWLWQAIKVHDYTRLLRALLHCYIGHWPRRDCQADKK